MQKFWDQITRTTAWNVNQVHDVLAWQKVLFLDKVYRLHRKAGTQQVIETLMGIGTILIMVASKCQFSDMIMLGLARRLMTGVLITWLIIKVKQGKIRRGLRSRTGHTEGQLPRKSAGNQ
jgi:hypothetical protein